MIEKKNKQTFIYHSVYSCVMNKKKKVDHTRIFQTWDEKIDLNDLPENKLGQKGVDEIVRRFTEAREKRKK